MNEQQIREIAVLILSIDNKINSLTNISEKMNEIKQLINNNGKNKALSILEQSNPGLSLNKYKTLLFD